MDRRDLFAAHAMQAIMLIQCPRKAPAKMTAAEFVAEMVRDAWSVADTMILVDEAQKKVDGANDARPKSTEPKDNQDNRRRNSAITIVLEFGDYDSLAGHLLDCGGS